MLVLGVWLADVCADHQFPVPTLAAMSCAFLSWSSALLLRRPAWWRSETALLLLGMLWVGVSLWTIRNRADEGQDVALLAASPEFCNDPAVRIIGDVANIPALRMPKDGGGTASMTEMPKTLLLLHTGFILRGYY